MARYTSGSCIAIFTTCLSLCLGKPVKAPFATTTLVRNGINPNHVVGPGISLGKVTRVYSRNSGKFVRIQANSADGAGSKFEKNAKLIIESAAFGGHVRIKSSIGSRYLCLSGHGSVVVEQSKQGKILDRCVFIQNQYKGYTVFQSKMNKNWFLGIKNDGRIKSAKKCSSRQRATHFLEL